MVDSPTNQRLDIGGYGYEIPPVGPLNGRPTVYFSFQDDESRREHWVNGSGFHNNTDRDVSAVMKMWEKYGWRSKVRSGTSNLVITGGEPLSEDNIDGTEAILSVLGRSNAYVSTSGAYQTSREVDEAVDGYIVRQNPSEILSDDENDEVNGPLWDISEAIRDDDGHFVFDIEENDDLNALQEVIRLYRIPRDLTWLRPSAEDPEQFEKIDDKCREMAKDKPFGYTRWNIPTEEDEEGDEE